MLCKRTGVYSHYILSMDSLPSVFHRENKVRNRRASIAVVVVVLEEIQ